MEESSPLCTNSRLPNGKPIWEDGNARGHLFLVQRQKEPLFQVSILQVDSATNEKKVEFTDYMSLEWDIDTQEHYIFYRYVNRDDMVPKNDTVRGLWFKDEVDRVAFHSVLMKAFEELIARSQPKNFPTTPPPFSHVADLGQLTPSPPTPVAASLLHPQASKRHDHAPGYDELYALFNIPGSANYRNYLSGDEMWISKYLDVARALNTDGRDEHPGLTHAALWEHQLQHRLTGKLALEGAGGDEWLSLTRRQLSRLIDIALNITLTKL